jgi:hypothetical protein
MFSLDEQFYKHATSPIYLFFSIYLPIYVTGCPKLAHKVCTKHEMKEKEDVIDVLKK